MSHLVILVPTTSHAIRIERILKKARMEVKLVPVPRHLSSDCGVAVRISSDERLRCEELIESAGASFDSIHPLDESD